MARKSLLPLLLAFFPPLLLAQVRRPSLGSHNVNFEGLADGSAEGTTRICDLSEGRPLSNEYAAKLAAFSGPGFGALNGGVPAHACSLWDGLIPPLGNHSFDGLGFLAFSTMPSNEPPCAATKLTSASGRVARKAAKRAAWDEL